MNWNLAKAKDNLSDLIRRALSEGPQSITVRGKPAVVVLSTKTYDRMKTDAPTSDFKAFLKRFPPLDDPVDLPRREGGHRAVEL